MRRLYGAGMLSLRFWGAPDGVAIVAPIEQIDDSARPVRKISPDTVSTVKPAGPVASILEGFYQLLSEPIRVSRILLFVLTDDSRAKAQTARMTTEIARLDPQLLYAATSQPNCAADRSALYSGQRL
jgi:hypothetical protein